jgi:hypothetical protein
MRALRTLAILHLVVNALLLWLGYSWLGIGETRAATLIWSFLVALLIASLACWTYGAAFAFFRIEDRPGVWRAWRTALRNLAPLGLAMLCLAVIYVLLQRWADYSPDPAARVASYLTLHLRKPVRPASVLRIFSAGLWLVRWVVLPVLWLPLVPAIAEKGWAGFRVWGSPGRRWIFWLQAPLLLLGALWLPFKLLDWVPHLSSFSAQMASFSARFLAAYLLFIACGLLLAFVTSGGRPRFTQPNTAVSP